MSIIIPNGGKRLSKDDNYERPTKTITEIVQNKKGVEEQLINFEEVPDEDVSYINLNTQIKYLIYDKKTKKELFRFGGLLVKVAKDYVVLAGKDAMRFSVQRYVKDDRGEIIYTTRFFKKVKDTEILKKKLNNTTILARERINQKEEIINEKEEIIKEQEERIKQQTKEIMAMKKKLGIKK